LRWLGGAKGISFLAVLALGCAMSGCGPEAPATILGSLKLVSAEAPFPPSCNGVRQIGALYLGTAVEPFLAVDPADPAHFIGVWQQDRWSDAGANGLMTGVSHDAGRTWIRTSAHLSRCTGGRADNGGNYERASDPWVTFSPDGTAYQISVSFNNSAESLAKAILVSRSTDGGLTWDEPVTLTRDEDRDSAVDKESITADPRDPSLVYAVWDRLSHLSGSAPGSIIGPTWFTRLFNGQWEQPRVIYDPGPDAQTISNQVVVLPDGTLLDFFLQIAQMSTPAPDRQVALLRSTDQGHTWSGPIVVEQSLTVGVADPKNRRRIRSGALVPAVAADPRTGKLYVAWQDSRFSGGARDAIVVSSSADGGRTWSSPKMVNQAHGTPAFTPAIAVSESGRVGVTYYDFRYDDGGNNSSLMTSYWLATSVDDGASWEETPVGTRFDLRTAPMVDGYFVGDYQGLVSPSADSFIPFFSAATFPQVGNPTGIFIQPASLQQSPN
jgi:hypothetical protein